jgi:hypothetical protein
MDNMGEAQVLKLPLVEDGVTLGSKDNDSRTTLSLAAGNGVPDGGRAVARGGLS